MRFRAKDQFMQVSIICKEHRQGFPTSRRELLRRPLGTSSYEENKELEDDGYEISTVLVYVLGRLVSWRNQTVILAFSNESHFTK